MKKLKVCCGSPLYLKNTFGSGYKLTISKNISFNDQLFKSFLNEKILKYSIETNIAAEMNLSIPFNLVSKIPELLDGIEQNKNKIGIDSYGISSPTIEEVFIKYTYSFLKVILRSNYTNFYYCKELEVLIQVETNLESMKRALKLN